MLILIRSVYYDLISHAREDFPVEACGYLAGKDNIIYKSFRLRNIDNSSEHFSFAPEEQFSVYKKVRELELNIMGVYHSHPFTPARMSDEDIRLAYDRRLYYLIVSLAQHDPVIKIFQIDNNTTKDVEFEVKEDI